MVNSKAIELLMTFSEPEFRKFGSFIRSPYFNGEKVQVKFYGLIKKYYPQFDHKNFTKEKLHTKLYLGKKYSDGVMRNILSSTLELAQRFLVAEKAMQMGENSYQQLFEELLTRKQHKLSENAISGLNKNIEYSGIKDENYFSGKFTLEGLRRKLQLKQKSSLQNSDEHLRVMAENLTNSFLINFLRVNTLLINSNRNIFKYNFDAVLTSEVESLHKIYKDKFESLTYLDYFYCSFKLAQSENEKYFRRLKNILDYRYGELRDADKSNIFSLLTNYCYTKINNGNLEYRHQNFELHKEHIERGFYKGEKGYLSHIMYINVAVTGLESGEFNWIDQFLDKYKNELDVVNKMNTYNFCRALYYYHLGDYDKSLVLAAKVQTDDLSYKHQLKSLYLKIFFDMNAADQFYTHIDSYRHFLANENNTPQITRDMIGTYAGYAKKLFDIKENTTNKDYDLFKLKKEITESKSVINKQWLLDKIKEMESAK